MIDMPSYYALFGDEFKEKIAILLQPDEISFSDLARRLGLDPSSDFRFAQLDFVSFDGSDLRGFDFSGADLSGSTGRNCIFDETTKLESAILDCSCFLSTVFRKRLTKNPRYVKIYELVRRESWIGMSLWIGENLAAGNPELDEIANLCMVLFDEDISVVVKSDILLRLSVLIKNQKDYRDFLAYAFHSTDDIRSRKLIIRALRKFIANDITVGNLIFRLACSPEEILEIRQTAFAEGMKSGASTEFTKAALRTPEVLDYIGRKILFVRVCQAVSPQLAEAAFSTGKNEFDYYTVLDRNEFKRFIARCSLRIDGTNYGSGSSQENVAKLFLGAKARGIPIKIADDLVPFFGAVEAGERNPDRYLLRETRKPKRL